MRVFVPAARRRPQRDLQGRRRSSACRCGTCGRACRRSRTCSRRRSARNRCLSTTRAIATTAAARRAPGRVVDRDRVGRHRDASSRKRAFLALLLVRAGSPFIVRAVQIWIIVRTIRRRRSSRRSRETFRQFLEQQDFFVFFITVYVGAGLIANDRRANALQIYLSKPLMRIEYIVGKLAVLFAFLLLVTCVPAMLLLVAAGDVRGSFAFLQQQPVPDPGDHRRRLLQVLARVVHDAGAVVALEERRYVGILYAGITVLHRGDLRRALRDHRQHAACRGSRSAPTWRRWST